MQSCQAGDGESYSHVAPYKCSCCAFEWRVAWILQGCHFGGWKRHSHIWLCVLQWTEFPSGRQRGKNNLLKPLLEQKSASCFPNWVVFFSPYCCSWRAGPANTLHSLFQACRSCFATERESSAGRGYSQRWQSLECPSLSPDGESNSAQSSLLWDFAAFATKELWEWSMTAASLQHGYSVTATPCN